jgi:hypothetical protein
MPSGSEGSGKKSGAESNTLDGVGCRFGSLRNRTPGRILPRRSVFVRLAQHYPTGSIDETFDTAYGTDTFDD